MIGGEEWAFLDPLTALALAAFLLGLQHSLSGARYHRARSVHVTADERVPCQVDGDPAGFLPAAIEVLDRRLRVVVP